MNSPTHPIENPVVSPELRRIIIRRILTPVTIALAVVAAVVFLIELGGLHIPVVIQLIPFAISIVVFGLPHGALDHLVPARMNPRLGVRRSVVLISVLYLVVGGVTAALWIVAPPVGFAAFIGLTWFHWGQGDLYIDHVLVEGPAGRRDAIVTVALRGALPMMIPLVAHPGDYGNVFADTVRAVSPSTSVSLGVLADPPIRLTAAAVVAVLVFMQLVLRRRSRRPVARACIEIVVLIAFFVVVPPIMAIGLYFTLWHSVRHILRLELLDIDSAKQLQHGLLLALLMRFFRLAWPITFIAVLVLVAVAFIARQANLGVYLVVIAALTTPHAVVVTGMDFWQGSWRTKDGAVMPTRHQSMEAR